MRRTIIADENGRYKYRTIVPLGYGCPPDGPTQELLNHLGRHGNRPAHIHYFVSAEGHRKLTTDRKSTRLNSSHVAISYAVFCLKKKNKTLKIKSTTAKLQHIQ